jgi:ferrous iron transport protein B
MQPKTLTIALAGNPNSGKTTIFNAITGTRQKVGNWPGVTVEKKEGVIHKYGYELKIVDLPGTYSLTPFSIEEIVARDFILEEKPDVVIDIIDASNLERSLYLASQMREIDCRVLFALNMADLARKRGTIIDTDKLSEILEVPVVFTVGNKNEGIDALLKKAIELAESDSAPFRQRQVRYTRDIEVSVSKLQDIIEKKSDGQPVYNSRWTAVKLLENDKIIREHLLKKMGDAGQKILWTAEDERERLAEILDDEPEIVMTDERYGFIESIVLEVMTVSAEKQVDMSRKIDRLLTDRFIGFPIFVFFIWAMFQTTFSLGHYPMEWIGAGVKVFSAFLEQSMSDSLFKDLLINGIVAGVGSVVVFLPNILILFFCIAIFEDTGYMARAAFLMDRIMHLIGLHGKSFIPMLMGFGCNVPAIMATRTLESEKDRILTILITPFMSCSARLPVYIILSGAFFGPQAGTVIFSIYLVGILISILSGRLLRSTLLKGIDAPFVMEMPPYRVPMLKNLIIHMWDRSKMFLKKMGGVILIGSIVVWTLSAFPRHVNYSKDYDAKAAQIEKHYETRLMLRVDDSGRRQLEKEKADALAEIVLQKKAEQAEKSFMGHIGKFVAPFFAPIGIDWRGSVALLSGFVAKEIVVSTMGVLYAADEETGALKNALRSSGMTPLAAFSMMIFVLLYVPCLATVAVIRRETNSFKWMFFNIGYSTAVAWIVSFCVYQGGKWMGMG